ncbi:hypothetical protein GCM10009624_08640 [Gordonia sinesedis]
MRGDDRRAGSELPDDPELRALAERLVPGVWPTADIAGLRDLAARCRAVAAAIGDLADETAAAVAGQNGVRGRFPAAVVASGRRVVDDPRDGLRRNAARIDRLGAALDAYAAASGAARDELTMIAAIADRDRLAGAVSASLGDDSARVAAASAGRMALSAAGDEYVGASGQAGTAGDRDRPGDDSAPPAATSGMMPMGALGAMGAMGAVGGVGIATHARRGPGGAASDEELGRSDTGWLVQRAHQVQSSLRPPLDEWIRTAVGIGAGPDGERVVVVATSDPHPYHRTGLDVRGGEVLAANGRPPEVAVLETMTHRGVAALGVAAALPGPAEARAALAAAGVPLVGPQPG